MAYETTTSFNGNDYVDGVLWGYWGGTSSTSASKWSSDSLTYSFSGYWTSAERAAAENALDIIESVSGLTFQSSSGSGDLTFNQYSGGRDGTLGFAYPPDRYWGSSNTGDLYYNDSYTDYWNASTLNVGGVGFTLLMHELGHAIGLGHPHDNSYVLPGVSSSSDTGDYKLNQNIYTVMSYNEIGTSLADGTQISPYALSSYGFQTLGAFDIAALQHLYGASSHNTGGNTYTIADSNGTGTYYQTIWDTGGEDTISYGGSRAVKIDLQAATLNAADGMLAGGAVSKADGIYGGFTIANGVVIENAIGGSGNDLLTGNSANNILQGNAGSDILDGGSGSDTASYVDASGSVVVNLQSRTATGADGNDTLTSIENITGSAYADTLTGDDGDNILQGGAGNDSLNGGSGTDTASYVEANGGVTVFLLRGSASGADGNDTFNSIEGAAGSNFDDVFVVGASGAIAGNGGNDTLSFEDATSTVVIDLTVGRASGGSNVTFTSIEGFIGSSYDDVLRGDANASTLNGGDGSDVLMGRGGDDVLIGGAGSDFAFYATASAGVSVDLATGLATGGDGSDSLSGIENIRGSAFGDNLSGDAGANILVGDDGDDTLTGGAGNDTLYGGAGIDTASYEGASGGVVANLVTSTSSGADGNDTLIDFENLTGSDHADALTGGSSDNVIIGGAGNDDISGGYGNDSLDGGKGDDLLDGGLGADTLTGGEGDDAYIVDSLADTVIEVSNGGFDIVRTSLTDYQLADHVEAVEFVGTNGDANLVGNAGANHLFGGAGNDMLRGGMGGDRHEGGAGTDAVTFALATTQVAIDLIYGGVGGEAAGDVYIDIEDVIGSAYDDSLTGDDGANAIYAGGGNDWLNGRVGADLLFGEDGDDFLWGDAGDDELRGGSGSDTLVGGWGADHFDGGAGDDTVTFQWSGPGIAVDLIYGGVGGEVHGDVYVAIENVIGSNYNDDLTGDFGGNAIYGGDGDDWLSGRDGADRLEGGAGSDSLWGGSGNDILLGGDGDDLLVGGWGTDHMDGGDGVDTISFQWSGPGIAVDLIYGGIGGEVAGDIYISIENVTGSAYNDDLTGDASANVLVGGAGDDWVSGREGADTLSGEAGDDFLWGGNGDDDLSGGDGADLLVGGWGADRIDGGDGTDTISFQWSGPGITVDLINGGSGAEVEGDVYVSIENVTGSAYNDVILGSENANELLGGGGADVLQGRGGEDILSGGAGDDLFVFANGDGADRIEDFASGAATEDRIDLRGVGTVSDMDDLLGAATQQAADTVIDFGSGDTVTLIGVDRSSLHSDDFLF